MALVMDHVVLLVDDLDRASNDFEAPGFTVEPGGDHGNNLTHNALIFFEDGTFLELFAIKSGWRASLIRFLYRAGALGFLGRTAKHGTLFRFIELANTSEGLADFCLLASSVHEVNDAVKRAGLHAPDAMSTLRVRPDGREVRWQMVSLPAAGLPFLRTPYVPTIRPEPELTHHKNGAKGIARLQIESPDPSTLSLLYARLLGTEPRPAKGQNGGPRTFQVGSALIDIVQAKGASDARGARRSSRGLRTVALKASTGAPSYVLGPARTHGADIRLIA
ncbi:MAG: VOC family protein [Polyangiales bacterium]|jgi:hypothetical protein